jgi:hypothetical protein
VIAPLVAIVIALGVYPQLLLTPTERSARAAVAAARGEAVAPQPAQFEVVPGASGPQAVPQGSVPPGVPPSQGAPQGVPPQGAAPPQAQVAP